MPHPNAPIPPIFESHILSPPHNSAPRYTGFGRRDHNHTLANTEPPIYFIIHLAWEFLEPRDRMCLAWKLPVFTAYASLRMAASTMDISPLQSPRGVPDSSPVDPDRVHMMGCAFLRFQCDYGDLARWLGGSHTDAHRNWDEAIATMETVRDFPPPDQFPNPDYTRTFQACTEGVPLVAHYKSDYESCVQQNLAPLSNDLKQNADDVNETLRKEEKLNYHIIFPRFLWRFIPGLLLSIFRVAYRYGDPKPCLCVDPTTRLSPDDTGNVNSQIPRPGLAEDENPTIHYGTAFIRYLQWIWNLRITYPDEDILQLTDDISAAFHRVLYHPDIAAAFATVWCTWLIIPIATIFGCRSSPGTYMWKGKMRAHLGHHLTLPPEAFECPLIQRLKITPLLTATEASNLAPATIDTINPGILIRPDGNPERRLPAFVDDTGIAHIRSHIIAAAAASVHAAYVIFGQPDEDPHRPPCINPAKWSEEVSYSLIFLGYEVNTRTMMVGWPVAKREKLRLFLDVVLSNHSKKIRSTPLQISRVLGLIRHAAFVAPMGTYRSLRLQHFFNDILSRESSISQLRRWYQRSVITIPPTIIGELQEFRSHTLSADPADPYWCRHIGLLVPRVPTITVYTDASSTALGGWSPESDLNHMWRITVQELESAGLLRGVGWKNTQNYHEPSIDPPAFHINILEFFAIFIEIWICVRQLSSAATKPNEPTVSSNSPAPAEKFPAGGHRLLARADNTSALSWLRYASRTKRAPVRALARLLTAFLAHPFASSHIRLQANHIPGVDNVEADHLSRFKLSPSWEAVMANNPHLKNLRTCQIPLELLSMLVHCYSQEPTEEWFATATTKLWTIDAPIFATGSARLAGTTTSVVHGA
jgi:hypothetical protein